MIKKYKILLGAAAAFLLVCLCVVLVMFGGDPGAEPATTAGNADVPVTYTVQVKNQGGLFLPNVGVYIYEDNTLGELVWFAKTDDSGKMTFTDKASDSYVAVLADVPTGYAVEQMYPITGELTEIILSAAQMSEVTEDVTYKLGDMMMDFTVEDAEGDTYTLSKLLEQKKAVVLNFWYTTCGPCKAEFPYLQEAYEKHKDNIAVLAMNPVNTAEEVTRFQKEMGLTFPMMACDPLWADMMQITAYPTTVVVDRYGNITLIHKGSIDSTKMFEDVFAYFAAEDYQQKLIRDIKDLETEAEEGTEENPVEIGGVLSFEVTVKPGETVYSEVYKVTGMYMQVQGKDYKLLYNNKEYTPTKGVVGLVVTTGDVRTPAQFGITNTGTETATYKFAFSFLPGTMDNPYAMKLGEFDVSVPAGSEKGVYYTYTAAEDGVLTVQCLGVTPNVKYGYTLYNLDSSRQHTLDSEGEKDENGIPALSIEAKKGQTVQFIAATVPDDSGNYPAAALKFLASFSAGGLKEEIKEEKLAYTVTVSDETGKGIPGVTVYLSYEKDQQTDTITLETNEAGVASAELAEINYAVLVKVPAGYTAEKTAFELTAEAPTLTVPLVTKEPVIMVDYTVKVVDTFGMPVAGVTVMIDGYSSTLTTNDAGVAAVAMEKGSYKAYIFGVPEGYVSSQFEYAFTADDSELTITLSCLAGSEKNPIVVDGQFPIQTGKIAKNGKLHYMVSGADGMILTVEDSDAYVIVDGVEHKAVGGVVTVALPESNGEGKPLSLIIGNGGQEKEAYTVNFAYPLGTERNPIEIMGQFPVVTEDIAPGVSVYYSVYGAGEMIVSLSNRHAYIIYEGVTYGADENGLVTFQIRKGNPRVPVTLAVGNGDETEGAGAESYTLEFTYPLGHAQNPRVLGNLKPFTVNLTAGDEDGYYYLLTAGADCLLSFNLSNDPGVECDIILSKDDSSNQPQLSESDDGKVSIYAYQGEEILIQVVTVPDAQWNYPAAQIKVNISVDTSAEPPAMPEQTEPGETQPQETEPEETEPELTEPEETEPILPDTVTYSVAVTNQTGIAAEGSIYVMLFDENGAVGQPAVIADANDGGEVEIALKPGNYTVTLTFTAPGNVYKYTKGVLTPDIHSITMPFALELSPSTPLTEYFAIDGLKVYDVALGGTYINLESSQENYVVVDGEPYCFFQYMVTEPGYYSFTTSNGTVVTGWGMTPNSYLSLNMSSEGKENNTFSVNLTDQTINENNPEAPYIIGVKASGGIENTVLVISRRKAQMTVDIAPWTTYVSQAAPPVAYEDVQWVPKGQIYDLPIQAGQTLKYVNIKNDTIVKGTDGKYHLNSESGPELYVFLGSATTMTQTRYSINFYDMLGLDGVGGTQFGRVYYNEDGTPKTTEDENGDLVYYKESFVDAMIAYTLHADPDYGVYPLNDDLLYMLRYGGEHKGWYGKTSPNYLFGNASYTPENAWKFVICYLE